MSCLREALNRVFWALAENEQAVVLSDGAQAEVRFVSPSKSPTQIAAACLDVEEHQVRQLPTVVMFRETHYNSFVVCEEALVDCMGEDPETQLAVLLTVAFCGLSAAFEELMRAPPRLCSEAQPFLATASRLYGRLAVQAAVASEPIFCPAPPDAPGFQAPQPTKRSRVHFD